MSSHNNNNNYSSQQQESSSSLSSSEDVLLFNNLNQRSLSITQQRLALPVYQLRKHILHLLETKQTLVVVGHTGCGKTTQIPQYLYEAGWCDGGRCIAVTQPRRVAATSVAVRVAEEMGESTVGGKVGYTIRFDDQTTNTTAIKYMTDGMLLREMMVDPLLSRYPVVMIDEAHERSLSTDLVIGLLKKVMVRRPDLRVIVSSATLDAEDFCNYFNLNKDSNDKTKDTCAILSIEGRNYPVDLHYLEEPTANYVDTTVKTIVDIHLTQTPGDVLVFLTGQDEIETVRRQLIDRLSDDPTNQQHQYTIVPIYSGLPLEKQMKVFAPPNIHKRKIVLATNIAETSITIDGIVYVVDCGFVKIKSYSGRSGTDSLVVVPTSQASANQRAGRAGRNRSGKCYRLYTEAAFAKLDVHTIPEIQRSNLSSVVLQLKALGIDNILAFDFLSPPVADSLVRALELLYALGAIDDYAKLTSPIGMTMAELPTEPPFSKMILSAASDFGCSEECLSIVAMLTIPGIQYNQSLVRKQFGVKEGDHLTLLNIYNSYVDIKQKDQSGWCHDNGLNAKAMTRVLQGNNNNDTKKVDPSVLVRKAIVSGFFSNAARLLPDGSYQTIKDKRNLWIHPTSIIGTINSPEWVIFHDVIITTKEFMKELTVIEPNWLSEIAPHYYSK
ncbi:DEAD/DEAH box helicase [Cavenderia fasciculata]|uniref:RNA helicase n=1 Tax=Cavenderia fasciculata TaxID=261658 RepID=F4PJS4_CACFS|nr:DEAD/DEAH box helicase [Cavenderia fasciculata]EGG23848.1 DEAD/DEAH box helicase [Cavenderia fasciculata]|eukprot:XP_004361699.1 DEAD/DEAH box helicase [Cavenderia fasciculata]